jgi:lipopolysaccharide transport system permease protein
VTAPERTALSTAVPPPTRPAAQGSSSLTVIRPVTGLAPIRLRELWEYRELLYFLAWRDIKVRYKQTVLGAAWAVLQPLLTMVIFSVLFGRLARLPSDGVPYPVFAFCALVPWTYFATALTQASNSLVDHSALISKIYLPRVLLPLARVVGGLVDLALASAVLGAMLAYYGIVPGPAVLTLPFFVLLAATTAFAVSLWLAALNVRYRDVRHVIPFLIQIWLFATPIAYSASLVPERWRALYGLNPMAGVVDGFRWALLGRTEPPGALVALSGLSVVVILAGGLFYFRRMERSFADTI